MCLGQEVGDRRGDEDAGGEGHKRMKAVPEAECRDAAGKGRHERENGREWHGALTACAMRRDLGSRLGERI